MAATSIAVSASSTIPRRIPDCLEFSKLATALHEAGKYPPSDKKNYVSVSGVLKETQCWAKYVTSGLDVIEGIFNLVKCKPGADQHGDLHSLSLDWLNKLTWHSGIYQDTPKLLLVGTEIQGYTNRYKYKERCYLTGRLDIVLYDPEHHELVVADIKTFPDTFDGITGKMASWVYTWPLTKKLCKLKHVMQLGIYVTMLEDAVSRLPDTNPFKDVKCGTAYLICLDENRKECGIFRIDASDRSFLTDNDVVTKRFHPEEPSMISHIDKPCIQTDGWHAIKQLVDNKIKKV
jgi:hypothetical protein